MQRHDLLLPLQGESPLHLNLSWMHEHHIHDTYHAMFHLCATSLDTHYVMSHLCATAAELLHLCGVRRKGGKTLRFSAIIMGAC